MVNGITGGKMADEERPEGELVNGKCMGAWHIYLKPSVALT